MIRARILAGAAAVCTMATAALVGTAPDAAATTYRYWIYWNGDKGSWSYSQVGPGSRTMHDGSVDGWRFGRSAASSSAVTPRQSASYSTLCGDHPTSADGTQVAVVIDWGTEPDSPGYTVTTYCVEGSTGAAALTAAVGRSNIRADGSGLVCAIRDYPKAPECGKTVAPATSSPRPAPTSPRPTTKLTSAAGGSAGTGSSPGSGPGTQGSAVSSTNAAMTGRPSARPSATAQPSSSAGSSTPAAAAAGFAPTTADAPGGEKPAGGLPFGLIGGVALLLAVGGAAIVRARRP